MTPEGYGDFLCAVFDEWIKNDIGRLEIQQVAEMALVWSGGDANLCWMAPTCERSRRPAGEGLDGMSVPLRQRP